MGKTLVAVGLGIAVLGGLLWAVASFAPGLQPARLPGDIVIERPGVYVYFPVVTSLVVSAVLSLVLWFLRSRP
ncbi:MAG: DUF2905 domain-containing protein [Fimbriimonadaceae bacterium]|nr:DUF2905 domain-containing protein [Fimbriimonadaceae bacterium]